MKTKVTFAVLLFLGLTVAYAQKSKKSNKKTKEAAPVEINVNGPGMVFDTDVIDFGEVDYNSDGNRVFNFKNNGNKPLVITNASSSCGCTIPTYPKEPVAPGAKGVIGVKYDTARVGAFNKTITLTTNMEIQNKTLTIKGTVKPAVQ